MKFLRKQLDGLKQGDPRAVAFTVVFLFLLSVLWFSYTWLAPGRNENLPLSDRYRPEPVEEEVRLSQVLSEEKKGIEGDPLNPFYLKPPAPTPRPRPTPKPKDPDTNVKPTPAPPVATPDPPQPQRETVTYVFQGMLRRPDGVAVALVSIPKQATSRYVREGDDLAPFTVMKVYQEGVEIRRGEDLPLLLQRGEPQTFDVEQ